MKSNYFKSHLRKKKHQRLIDHHPHLCIPSPLLVLSPSSGPPLVIVDCRAKLCSLSLSFFVLSQFFTFNNRKSAPDTHNNGSSPSAKATLPNQTMTDAEEKQTSAAESHDIELTPFTLIRYVLSIGMLIFSIIIVGALMFTGNTRVATETNPWVSLIVCVSPT